MSDSQAPSADVALPSTAEIATPAVLLVLLLSLAVPLFLRMPLTNDTEVYDLQAAVVRDGGVLYRDLLEPNLPGVVAVHLAVRGVLGDSPEAMRAFDLMMLILTVVLAGSLLRRGGATWRTVLWSAFGIAAYYLSISEWCHCQRDGWMLVPAFAAMLLRAVSLTSPTARSPQAVLVWGVVEGLLWGAGVWLKPYVAIPAALVWAATLRFQPSWRHGIAATVGVLAGGMTIGLAGIGLMVASGCWPYFLDTARHWNPAYFAAGRAHWSWGRLLGTSIRLSPWWLLHGVAVVIVIRQFVPRSQDTVPQPARSHTIAVAMIGAAYAGWLLQAGWLQHQFDYVFAPTVILAMLLIAATSIGQSAPSRLATCSWMVLGAMALLASPLTDWQRLRWWSACVTGPATPALRDDLSHFQNPSQEDLARVADYLRSADVQGRDVCCYNSDFVSLYRRLGLRPPMKYTYLFETLQFFPDRRDDVLNDVRQAAHRFVVTDLVSCGMPREQAEAVGPDGPEFPPPAYQSAPRDVYPWNLPVVFRSGTYLVHRVDAATPHETERMLSLDDAQPRNGSQSP